MFCDANAFLLHVILPHEKGYGKEWMRVCNGLFHPKKGFSLMDVHGHGAGPLNYVVRSSGHKVLHLVQRMHHRCNLYNMHFKQGGGKKEVVDPLSTFWVQ
jgi:hypothetical protein